MQRIISGSFFACVLLAAALSFNVAGQDASAEEPIRVGTGLVSVTVSVTDRDGRAVTGLEKNAFSVFDNERRQELTFFDTESAPASISIVFDTSASMDGRKIELARRALARFIATSGKDDEFFVIDFNSRARVLIDRTRDAEEIIRKFTYVSPDGRTALFDALDLGIDRASKGSRTKKIVLVISDGEDNYSRLSFRDIRRRLKESNEVVFAVGFGGMLAPRGGMSGRDTLSTLAKATGGGAYFPRGDVETDEAFEKIALEIRNLYSLGFYPDAQDATDLRHRVRVEVRPRGRESRPIVKTRELVFEAPTD